MSSEIGVREITRSYFNTAPEPRPDSRWTMLLAVLAGGVAGFVVANLLGQPTTDRAAPDITLQQTPSAWMSRARRLSEAQPDPAVQRVLTHALASNTALFAAIADEYGRVEERRFRVTVRELIVASARPDLFAAGTRLTNGAQALQRAAGFELLARLRPTRESYALAMRAVKEETDPTALAGALMALRHPSLPANADARGLLPRFVALARHPDALVRGHAIQQLSDWDKGGEQATPIVVDAISHPDRLVREAAIGAVMIGGLRSERLKQALLQTAGNPAEDPTIRGSALHALERFVLTDGEQARYHAGKEKLERLTAQHPN
jgi:hypothetical protein